GILDSGRANPLALPAMQDLDSWLYGHGFISIPALLLLGLFNMVWRWRRSAGIERQQYRWLVSACTVMVTAMLLLVTNNFAGWSVALMLVALNALPVAVATAVTRYRLFDLERLISRTASYAVVTGLLVATYAVVVTAATQLLPRNSPLAVTVATLTAAALARPLYRRFQTFVDHRFNRTKYDAHRTVDAFGLRLRRQFDFEAVRVDLVEVVRESLEPQEVRLWVRPR
ncbi:MAG: histidine kinase N-terminal 7TM domain-containing protein, partial [Actinomycetes bacterium]